jgi:hypothetical protein
MSRVFASEGTEDQNRFNEISQGLFSMRCACAAPALQPNPFYPRGTFFTSVYIEGGLGQKAVFLPASWPFDNRMITGSKDVNSLLRPYV